MTTLPQSLEDDLTLAHADPCGCALENYGKVFRVGKGCREVRDILRESIQAYGSETRRQCQDGANRFVTELLGAMKP